MRKRNTVRHLIQACADFPQYSRDWHGQTVRAALQRIFVEIVEECAEDYCIDVLHITDTGRAFLQNSDKLPVRAERRKFDGQARVIRERHQDGETITALAREYETIDSEIRQILSGKTYRNEGGPIGINTAQLTDDDVIEIRKRFADGEPTLDVALSLNFSPETVRKAATGLTFMHLNDIAPPAKVSRKRGNSKRKISEADCRLIYDYFQQDYPAMTMKRIADSYGVSLSYISRIVSNDRQ